MKVPLLALAVLALAALLPPPAAAQQSAALTIVLAPPEDVLREGETLSFEGTVVFTADWTAALSLSGIPVTYSIAAAPEWASVTISPASDIFPPPSGPSSGASYTVARTFTVTVLLAREMTEDASGAIEIEATTTPGPLGHAASGKGSAPVVFDAPEEPCPEHALSQEQLALYAEQASEALAEYEASRGASDASAADEDVTVQSTGAAPLVTPWVAVGGLGLVGACAGFALRRRFSG